MAFYRDLSNSCQGGRGTDVRAVGWLSASEPFTHGDVPDVFVQTLQEHLASPWLVGFMLMGSHVCDLTHAAAGPGLSTPGEPARGHHQLYVPTATCVYIAPELIGHYVSDHRYQPPSEFIRALLACPQQGSPQFLAMLAPMRCKHGPCFGLHFDRQAEGRHAEERRYAEAWVCRGMCPRCEFWFYLHDGEPATHCGVPLIHIEYRVPEA